MSELAKFLQDQKNQRLFEQERLILDITEAICELMNEQGVTRAQLAQRLECTPSNISQLLDGENNFAVRTLVDLFFELGARVSVTAEPLVPAGSGGVVDIQAAAYGRRATVQYSFSAGANDGRAPTRQLAA